MKRGPSGDRDDDREHAGGEHTGHGATRFASRPAEPCREPSRPTERLPLTSTASPGRTSVSSSATAASRVGHAVRPRRRAGALQVGRRQRARRRPATSTPRAAASAPLAACSAGAVGPSSAIWPSTAMRRPAHGPLGERLQGGAERRRVRVVGVVDGTPPPGSSITSPRQRLQADRRGAAAGRPSSGTPSSTATVSAAQHVERLVAALERAARRRPRRRRRAAAAAAAGHRRRGRSSADVGPSRLAERAHAQARRAATARAAARRRARPPRPSSGSAASSSPLAAPIASRLPSSSRCAVPTLVTTPTPRPRERGQLGDLPEPAHRHLADRDLGVRLRSRHSVSGSPISLLWPAAAATIAARGPEHGGQRVLGRRLAEEPVMPTTTQPWPPRAFAAPIAAERRRPDRAPRAPTPRLAGGRGLRRAARRRGAGVARRGR